MAKLWWPARPGSSRENLLALTIILLFFILLFGPVILSGQFFVLYDASSYSYPLRTVAWDALRHGRLPLWTPLIMSGYPLFSMAQIALAYPLTWGYLFLPGYWAEEIYVLAPFLLAPAFMYAYARELGRSWSAALLAGLAFGYGGMFVIGYVHNGMLANSTMWLPLVLIGIERSRRQGIVPVILWTTGAYTMSVLTGIGQGFLLVGIVAVAYAIFLSAAVLVEKEESGAVSRPSLLSLTRWRPLIVALASILLSAGVAAVQILETARAARRSIRSSLEYGVFSGNSFNLSMSLKSLVAPLSPAVFPFDTSAYMAPLALLLALYAVVRALRKRQDARIFFWVLTAAIGWLLMLGEFLPFYRLLYYVPLLNLFRAPARHAFEWTFALSILAAYGWDAVRSRLSSRPGREDEQPSQKEKLALGLLVGLSLMAAAVWWRQAGSLSTAFNAPAYLFWKAVLTLLLLIILWRCWKLSGASRWPAHLLVCTMAFACFIEPCITITKWWWPLVKPASRFTTASPVTRLLQNFPPEQNRVYTRVGPFEMEYTAEPPVDPPNVTALYGLQNVAGYEPLILERYSRALGNVGFDTLGTRWGYAPDETLLSARSHVLDLLNDKYVVLYGRPFLPGQYLEKEGIRFKIGDEALGLKPGQRRTLLAVGARGDTLALVTTLAFAGEMADEEPVAKLRVFATDGRIIERELRAGRDTSEWAHERADVRASVRHRLAPVFDSAPGDDANTFASHRYWSRTALGESIAVDRVEIENITQGVELSVWKASICDTVGSSSMPLERLVDKDEDFDTARWQTVYQEQGVRLFRNERALPRAWLVSEVEAVDGEEALRRIRGQGEKAFDPRRVALLEVAAAELPPLPPAGETANATARLINSENNRLVIETTADAPSVLVLSEINYPGWIATVDGLRSPIYNANFLLRAVAVPAGRHQVEMRYIAPAARTGAVISICSLLLIGVLAVYQWRHKRRRPGN
jgi:hypothetical protein